MHSDCKSPYVPTAFWQGKGGELRKRDEGVSDSPWRWRFMKKVCSFEKERPRNRAIWLWKGRGWDLDATAELRSCIFAEVISSLFRRFYQRSKPGHAWV